ncbi:MAG: IS701-like element ISBj9 family transposase [Candidatus Dormibacteraceae bacterium]
MAAAESAERFTAYVEALSTALGHADRRGPFRDYCLGLLMPVERKSVEPLAAVTAPSRTAAQHQSLLHFVGQGGWSDERVLGAIRDLVLPSIERHGAIEAWIIDDTGFPKKGKHSVGVARQYCGQLGKQDNCQIAVSLSVANPAASLPIAYRLYLPEDWASDPVRRSQAGVPNDVAFLTKPEIALDQLRAALAAGIPRGTVLMDAGYGADTRLRTAITELGLTYAAGIQPHTTVWLPGQGPLPPKPWSGRGRPTSRLRRDAEHQPGKVKDIAMSLPASAWETITWREGSADPLISRFARLRVRAAHRDEKLKESRPEEWLLVEWPEDEPQPVKYWLSTLPKTISFADLVSATKLRWRIERDYQDLKQEVGLGHYEGRGWRGFHHHATLCIAAYGFLISERGTLPPSGGRAVKKLPNAALSPRGRPNPAADPAGAARGELHRDHAPEAHRRPRQHSQQMSLLPLVTSHNQSRPTLMTQ